MSNYTRPPKARKCGNFRIYGEIPRSDRNRYLSCIPLPKPIKIRLVQEFDSWVVHNGQLWAVERMKIFKSYVLQSFALPDSDMKVPTPSWFATNRHGGLKGIWGRLYHIAMRNDKTLQMVLSLLNVYTSVFYDTVPLKTLAGEYSSIVRKTNHHGRSPRMHTLKPNTVRRMLHRFHDKPVRLTMPIPVLQVPPAKSSEVFKLPNDILQARNLWFNLRSYHGRKIISRAIGGDPIPEDDYIGDTTRELHPDGGSYTTYCGTIHHTCEPGLKIRYFAAPNLVFQRMLEPLKDSLMSYLRHLPWDCTLNQRKADTVISTQLKRGSTVFSVDLSSATDKFPYWFQEVVLRAVLPTRKGSKAQRMRGNAYADLFHRMVKGNWGSEFGKLRWRVGQPLGLGPSFPLFSLSHGFLLLLLNGGKWRKQFYVVGDDVVILRKKLYIQYMDVLASWNVPISPSKSFSSNRIAQFAGKTYTPWSSFWTPKWVGITRTNLVDIAAFWYEGFAQGLKDEVLIDQVLALPQPYGIGRNPLGIPMGVRFNDKLIAVLLEREAARGQSAKTAHTLPWSSLVRNSKDPHQEVLMYKVKMSIKVGNPIRVGISRPLPFHLMDRTEVSGFPRTRATAQSVHRKRYSLGRTQFWNLVFQKLAQDGS